MSEESFDGTWDHYLDLMIDEIVAAHGKSRKDPDARRQAEELLKTLDSRGLVVSHRQNALVPFESPWRRQ